MSQVSGGTSLSKLMQISTQALNDCRINMKNNSNIISMTGLNVNQTENLLKLMETLVDMKFQMTMEIEKGRINPIDPNVIDLMELAIENAINKPLDAKVNQIYFSIFGYNSALWQVLKDMQKLLRTVEFLNQNQGKRVAKVEKKPRERRKKRHEKDGSNYYQEEEK